MNGTDAGNSTTPAKPKTVLKKFIRRFPLKVSVDYSELAVQPLSPKDKAASLRTYACLNQIRLCGSLSLQRPTVCMCVCSVCRLRRIKQVDEERLAREAAKNAVEAFIYASRNKLYDFAEDLAVRFPGYTPPVCVFPPCACCVHCHRRRSRQKRIVRQCPLH